MKRPAASSEASPKPKKAKGSPLESEELEKNTLHLSSQAKSDGDLAKEIEDTRILHERLKSNRAAEEKKAADARPTSEDAPDREVDV